MELGLITCVQQLVSHLSPTDFLVNNAVLRTAHSIFRRYVLAVALPLIPC